MKLRNLLRRGISLLLSGTLLFGSAPASALSPAETSSSQMAKVSGTWTLDLWHYSGGYWKVGNKGSEQIRIEDSQIRALDQYLQANQKAVFAVSVPAEVAALLSEGTRGTDWQVVFTDYRGRDCSMLFAESSPAEVTLKSGSQVEFSATPVFHFSDSNASLRDYVPGMSVTVPLVDKKYGYNIYSIFGNGQSAVQGLGYYNEDDPSDTGSNAIHPSFITGKSGALEGGHPITLGVNVVDSAGYSIGSGTFAAAGACGLHFEFPVSLVFTDLRTPVPEDPDPGEGPDGPGTGGDGPGTGPGDDPGGDPDDPVDPGDPTDPALPADGDDITGLDAILELPAVAYAGHDVEARDCSWYEVDGKSMNAARAAELGLGKSSFTIVQKGVGSIRKSGKTGAIAVFTKPGTYQVKLTATASIGLKDTDTQSIRILKTPAILEDLGGVQKENRKQKLLITVAQDPKNPVDQLSIKLTDAASSETISVEKVFGGAEKAPANAAHIKYRSLYDTGSDAYFLCVELDFLTKWHETRTLSYEIRVKDSAGGSDNAFGTFEVAPDLPPMAVIDLEDAYYRKEGTNTASITPVCASVSDGDALQRTWQFKTADGSWQSVPSLPGYADLSFGSRKSVRFDKTGVGPFSVKLTVKDVWTEETLPEYVSEADYLSHSAEKSSRVDNIAPRVSLDLLRTETAEVFLLTESDKAARDVLAAAPSLKAALLAEGIAAEVSADFRQAAAGDRTGKLTEVTTGGHGGRDYRDSEQQLYSTYFSGMWNGGNLVSDGRYSYMLTPSVQTYSGNPKYSIHTYPFTITARNSRGATVWTTTVSQAVLDSSTYLRDASWGFDADGTYLYLTDSGRTALFDIRTGTYVATLPAALGPFNLLTPESIYTFKETSIWRMPRSGGSLSCIYDAPLSCPAYVGGAVQFIAKLDLGKGLGLYRGVFDPAKESVRCALLEGSLEGYARDAQGIAIDASGAAFVRSGQAFYAYGADNALLRRMPIQAGIDSIASVYPVWRGDGRVNYLGLGGRNRLPKSREVWCCVYSVYTDDVYTDKRSKEDNYPNYGSPVVYALEDENGAIGVYFGCNYVYSTGERYLDTAIFSFNGTFRNPMGFPMEEGFQSIRYVGATANLNGSADIKQIVHVAESRADEEDRLKAKHLSYDTDYTYYAALNGTQTVEIAATAMAQIAQAVKQMKEQGQNAAVLSGAGALTRTISLAPDTTYFYEYDTTAKSDVFSVQAQLTAPAGMDSSSPGYRVTSAHEENFDDAAVDRFFTVDAAAVSGGRYRIGALYTRETSSAWTQSGSTYPIRFTVPDGYRAVLTMDFEYNADTDPLSKRLLLSRDGGTAVALDIPSAGISRLSGTYMHDVLLESGSYVLSSSVKERTKSSGHSWEFWLDNLKVFLVQEGDAQQRAGLQTVPVSSSVKGDGTMRRISGSFTTPRQVLHYAPYSAQRVTGLRSSYTSVSEEMRGYTKTLTLDLNIPAGQQALKMVFAGTGRGGSYTSSNTGKTRYYNASWSFDDALFGINTKESDGLLALYVMPADVRFAYRNLMGSHKLTASVNTNYGGQVAFSDLQMYLSNPGAALPAALAEGRFFEEGGRLYAEDLVYSGGGRIALTADDGTVIRNLRIWTVSGQTEDTALACSFKAEADLSGWTQSGTEAKILPYKAEKEEPARVYAKGETINYQVYYGDYENDPSKKQHWVYTHEPLSDGLHPQVGKDLAAPITKFWVDGKYTLTHWQEDSTGDPAYDKESNRVSITFYIQSGPGNDAPWVKSITTDPAAPKAGNTYTVKATVDDKDKDPLTVTIEVYKDSGSKPIGTKTVKDLKPDASGNYPAVVLSGLPPAAPGTYDIVVTVRDGEGADVDTLRFKVKEERSLTGSVTHTAAWEANRLAWNEAKKGTPAVRPANMFWPGETLVLNAPTGGEPVSVDAQILQFPQYAARLSRGSVGADGKVNFTGQLWHSSMLQTIGTAKPVPATVRFTARFADGGTLTWDVAIVFDQSNGSYYQLHRNY